MNFDGYSVVAVALAACAVIAIFAHVLVPSAIRRKATKYDPFEPATFIFISVFIGVFLRTILLAVTDNSELINRLNLGQPVEFLIPALTVSIVAIVLLSLGQIACPRCRFDLGGLALFQRNFWRVRRVAWISILLVGLASLGIVMLAQESSISISSLSDISAKRYTQIESGQVLVAGYSRWLAALGAPALYVSLAYVAAFGSRNAIVMAVITIAAAFAAVAFPVLVNTRGGLVNLAINSTAIWYYLRVVPSGRKLPLLKIAALASFLVVSITLLMAARSKAETIGEVASYFSPDKVLESLAGDGNFFGVEKVAHVLDKVPETSPFLLGESLLSWVYAPIPRSLWENKPVALAFRFRHEIYDLPYTETSGYPPGVVVELYWNFGLAGVLIGMFILGVLLGAVYRSFRPLIQAANPSAVVLYVCSINIFTQTVLGGDLSDAIIRLALVAIPLLLAVAFLGARRRRGGYVGSGH